MRIPNDSKPFELAKRVRDEIGEDLDAAKIEQARRRANEVYTRILRGDGPPSDE